MCVLEMRGVSSCEYVREKDKQGTGAKQRWEKWGPGELHVVVILGRARMADHV